MLSKEQILAIQKLITSAGLKVDKTALLAMAASLLANPDVRAQLAALVDGFRRNTVGRAKTGPAPAGPGLATGNAALDAIVSACLERGIPVAMTMLPAARLAAAGHAPRGEDRSLAFQVPGFYEAGSVTLVGIGEDEEGPKVLSLGAKDEVLVLRTFDALVGLNAALWRISRETGGERWAKPDAAWTDDLVRLGHVKRVVEFAPA